MMLDEKIARKIEEFEPYLKCIPGVVIIHYLNPSTVLYMTPSGLKILDISLQELQDMGTEYYNRFFNPEDAADYVPKILGMLERNDDEETISFFQQVRADYNEEWKWYVSGARIFMHDDDGNPLLTITVAMPIDSKHFFTAKIERLLAENEFLRKNQHLYAHLSKRERQILTLMARDKSSIEIAAELHLSDETVKTHRRNIKRKIGTQTQYDVVRFSQSFDLI